VFELIWSENFDQKTLDKSKWQLETGGHGFGNGESQYYTAEEKNVRIENNQLVIEAHKETYENQSYTSAKLTTHGLFSMTYGRVEIKAKLPKGSGTWPAVWMMPDAFKEGLSWPRCGEIDIMEHIGRREDHIHFSLHTEKHNHIERTQDTFEDYFEGISDRFAVYSMNWTPDHFEFFIDDVSYAKFDRRNHMDDPMSFWPFDQPYYLIINLAIGGYWGGHVDDAIFPVRFVIDNVQVYRLRQ
jgi:beta-glucanase (GH16 family)